MKRSITRATQSRFMSSSSSSAKIPNYRIPYKLSRTYCPVLLPAAVSQSPSNPQSNRRASTSSLEQATTNDKMHFTWKSIASEKQKVQKEAIPKEWLLKSLPPTSQLDVRDVPRTCGILNAKELEITENYDGTALILALRERKYTALEVATAFCKRAAIAQQLTSCLTEIFFDRALARAKELDEYFERTGRPYGPLHGLPISVKDSLDIVGLDSSIGIAALANKPAVKNAALVDILLKAGAVLYVKTNIPQTLMALDSINNCFGRTLNPANRLLTAGGSSGGEGALIAMRGSLLGVGTDIGGSIRIPAMCNGLFGIKPSVGRVPYGGQICAMRKGGGKLGLASAAGPLATSLRDCELFLKTISESEPWECQADVVPGFWESQGQAGGQWEPPVFGVLRTDLNTTPLPPIAKALDETVQALRNKGLDVHEIDPTAFQKCQGLANKFFGAGGDNEMMDLLEETGEPLIPWLASRIKRRPAQGVKFLEDKQVEREALVAEMLKCFKTKDGRRIDVILTPVAPHPVPEVDRWNATGYTASFVLLDWATGVIPVRACTNNDIEIEMTGEVRGNWDKRNRELWDKKTVDRKLYVGSPLSIQVLAPRLQERRLVEGMKIIQQVLDAGADAKAKL